MPRRSAPGSLRSTSRRPAGPSISTRSVVDGCSGRRAPLTSHQASDAQPLHHAAVLEMLLDDLVDVFLVDVGVPHGFRVDHHHGTQLTAIHASRLIDADLARAVELQRLDAVLGVFTDLARPVVVAALSAGFALIAAE